MGLSADVARDIKDARAFVLSSDYEGVPNALLEAMALGLPCIATDCLGGGPRMVIEDGVNGLLIPMGDEAALAEAMRRLLRDPEAAERMGRAARETAESFRPDRVFADWRQYVEDILVESGGAIFASQSVDGLLSGIKAISGMNKKDLDRFGKNNLLYYQSHFTLDKISRDIEAELLKKSR